MQDVEIILFKKAANISYAYQIEQVLKHQFKNTVNNNDYGIFGRAEVLQLSSTEKITESIQHYLSDQELVKTTFDSIFKP